MAVYVSVFSLYVLALSVAHTQFMSSHGEACQSVATAMATAAASDAAAAAESQPNMPSSILLNLIHDATSANSSAQKQAEYKQQTDRQLLEVRCNAGHDTEYTYVYGKIEDRKRNVFSYIFWCAYLRVHM